MVVVSRRAALAAIGTAPLAATAVDAVTRPSPRAILSVYLASPLGFSESTRLFLNADLVPLLSKLGYKVINPWALTDPREIAGVRALPYGERRRDQWRRLNQEIGKRNEEALRKSDFVLAVLDGTDVDSGTAAEVGFAAALGKKVLGYRGDFRLSSDDEGALVNVQVEYFIRRSGGTLVTSISDIPNGLLALRRAS